MDAPDTQYKELAKPYQTDIDFAFFVANFGYSKADYEALTPREKAFIFKAWEGKIVSDTTHIRNAFLNGYVNAKRKKNKRIIPLWKKKQKRADKEVVHNNLEIIKENIVKEGKSWLDTIHRANGMKRKGGKR